MVINIIHNRPRKKLISCYIRYVTEVETGADYIHFYIKDEGWITLSNISDPFKVYVYPSDTMKIGGRELIGKTKDEIRKALKFKERETYEIC